jgi:hypothetical protein
VKIDVRSVVTYESKDTLKDTFNSSGIELIDDLTIISMRLVTTPNKLVL